MMKELNIIKVMLLGATILLLGCKKNEAADQDPPPVPISCQSDSSLDRTESIEQGDFEAQKTLAPMEIDGCSKDAIWSSQDWYDMNYKWMGAAVDSTDYYGRFKLAWSDKNLFVLVEIIDDSINPTLADGLDNYWKGDYVELFIDEDKSGGNHRYNHQAFAYHVSTEGHAIDKNTLEETAFFDNHIQIERTRDGNKHLWEMAIKLYDDSFDENATDNTPVVIVNQKIIGFSIAYGDNDGNSSRENFMGSKISHGNNNDDGYINSDVFGSIIFLE